MMNSATTVPPLNSVRHRVLRNALSKIQPTPDSKAELPPLKPGEMQLYSYFTPGLSTGLYNIVAEQTITTSDGQSKIITAPIQPFLVDAPRFSIEPSLIHSTFPLQGVAAQANILPHIVFNDPHLPWQTEIGKTTVEDTLRIPWLAVVAFEQSELLLPPDDPLFPSSLQGDNHPPQSFTMSTRMSIEKLTGSGLQCALPDLGQSFQEDPSLPTKQVDAIFPEMSLFLALFGNTADTPSISLDRYKYLAHARQVNTTHMTDAGVLDEGQFSVVFSHRTGPPFAKTDPPHPKRCVAHLVSLDWVNLIPSSSLTSNKRAALVSLYSWTYDCLPPETVNFEDVMKVVGKNSGVFSSPKEVQDRAGVGLPSTVQSRIQNRMDDGYTLLRYRVQTGEEAVALTRGPLTPRQVPDASWMDVHSSTGEDLQIFDEHLGIMDITYSAAWQLGKSLAIADQAFCAALLRIRASVFDAASENAKQDTLNSKFEAATSGRVIDSLSGHFTGMEKLAKGAPDQNRWMRPSLIQSRYELLAEQKGSDAYNERVEYHLRRHVEHHASATDGSHHTELKDPKSTDWDLVLNWLLNKIYLENIPPWYLISDPTWLPSECIRFFYVDHKWLSALVDGALSVANHLDADDKTRQVIKDQLLKYLNEDIHPILKHPPQVPGYGFLLRSVAVAAFPDLVVRAPLPDIKENVPDPRAEILRQENIRQDIMLCLLERTPKDLQQLIVSQPPHQQCFMFGQDATFTTEAFDLELRKVYSISTKKSMDEFPAMSYTKGPDGSCDIYDWTSRTIRVDGLVKLLSTTLHQAHEQDSDVYDGEINASLVGIELNDPIYRLTFTSSSTVPSDAVDPSHDLRAPSETFALPAGSSTVSALPPIKDYARPFKRTLRARTTTRGPPRMSGLPVPLLATPALDSPPTFTLAQKPPASATSPSILSDIDYDDMEKCASRYSPICFTLGESPPLAGDSDTKYVTSTPNGSSLIVRLARNQVEPNSTDFISVFEISIPLGSSADSLLLAPPDQDSLVMLNTARLMIRVKLEEKNVLIHLRARATSNLTPLSHNPDMSFIMKGVHINPDALDTTISIVELYTSKGGNSKVALNNIHHIQAKKKT